MNRFALAKIGEPARTPDLVALKNSGMALDRLHERARFTLLGRAALAEAAAAQSRPEFVDRPRRRRKIVRGEIVRVHRQVSLDALEPRDHAGQRAYLPARARS